MGCSSCGVTSAEGEVQGCQSNGGCSTGVCNKLNVFDWLSQMDESTPDRFQIVEVRFKNGGKEFFKNTENINLTTGDAVIVDVPNGHHLGHVSLQGELVRLQMRKKGVKETDDIKHIYRIASQRDLDKYRQVRNREMPTLYRTRQIIDELSLGMKLTDVEYQADNTKATFYYSAEDRVDFRDLIKRLAGEFKIRVEMKQISLRQEAARLGGIGSCGRELCCSTWLSEFKSVGTQAARYQNLSLNPSKLSGQCGRLKCCLNYELDTYVEALKGIPEISRPLLTEKGSAKLQKTDIFRRIMWFGYDDENSWYPLDIERVNEILALNKAGKKPISLVENEPEEDTSDGILNSDLAAMDKKFSKDNPKKPNRKKSKNRNKKPIQNAAEGSQVSKPLADNADVTPAKVQPKPNPRPQNPRTQNQKPQIVADGAKADVSGEPKIEGQSPNKNKKRFKNKNRNKSRNPNSNSNPKPNNSPE
jgi:cell fate regulator YaaT (PSP1 superfamily)